MTVYERCNACPVLYWDTMSSISFEQLFEIDCNCPFSHTCANMSFAWDKFLRDCPRNEQCSFVDYVLKHFDHNDDQDHGADDNA